MAGNFKMDDYVDVAQRIHDFYDRFPEGRLTTGTPPQVVEIGGKPFVWYHAQAFRTPDDPLPGDGWAAEPVPGPTQFTRDSELMNAETAAWGRAIVALGFSTKKIASAQEVQARQGKAAAPLAAETRPAAVEHTAPVAAATNPSAKQLDELYALVGEKNGDVAKTRANAEKADVEGTLASWYAAAVKYWGSYASKIPPKAAA